MSPHHTSSELKAKGMTKLGWVALNVSGLGPFWYSVWGNRDGDILLNGPAGLEAWELNRHGNIHTKEEVLKIDPDYGDPDFGYGGDPACV